MSATGCPPRPRSPASWRLAAQRRTEEDLAVLDEAWQRRQATRKAEDWAAFVEADLAFHRGVVAAAHNPVLASVFESFVDALRATLTHLMTDPEVPQDSS